VSGACFIRADASVEIGGGHVTRCMTLATELHLLGWQVTLASRPATFEVAKSFLPDWVNCVALPERQADDPAVLKRIAPSGIDMAVVDSYALDEEYEAPLRSWTERITVIDDLADRRHDCDVLIDQTYARSASAYSGLTPKRAEVLAGATYALMPREFADRRISQSSASRPGIRPNILVSFGLTDPQGFTLGALNTIVQTGVDADVTAVLGSGSEHLPAVVTQVARMNGARVLIDNRDMAGLMASADLCIGAAGTSALQRCCLGLPTIAMVSADNQRAGAVSLEREGAIAIVANFDDLGGALSALLENPAQLRAMSVAARRVCDGRGAARAVLHMAHEQNRDGRAVVSRPYAADDEEVVLSWQTAEARRYSRNPAPPSREEHMAWSKSRLADQRAVTEILCVDGEAVGIVRLDPRAGNAMEISILIAPDRQGRGIGAVGLKVARRLVPGKRFLAHVHPENRASQAIFARAGYAIEGAWLVQDDEALTSAYAQ
jgi:UDP-2,4-diacetamido-2,4,6-trideoxy-beta-L-altropyranose hydrolase